MAYIPTILEAGRADGILIKTDSVYDDNQEKFLSDELEIIDNNHNTLENTVNSLNNKVNDNKLNIDTKLQEEITRATKAELALDAKLETEKNRAITTEDNLIETINNITEVNGNATSANIVTIDPLPNSTISNVQQALEALYKNYTYKGIATPTTNPGTPDAPVFYIASTEGFYENFSGIKLTNNDTIIIKWNNGTWIKESLGFATQKTLDRELKTVQNNISNIIDYSFDIDGYEGNIIKYTESVILSSGKIGVGSSSQRVFEFNVEGYNFAKVWGKSPGSSACALASAINSTGEILKVYNIGQGIIYSNGIILCIPENTTTLRVFSDSFDPKIAVNNINLKSDIISINSEFPDDNYNSKEEARAKIIKSRRKFGLIISYELVDKTQITEKYSSYDYSDIAFLDSKNWITLLTEDSLTINIENEDISTKGVIGNNYILPNQTIGSEIQFGTFGYHKKYTIPANTSVEITIIAGGNYGFALVDEENKVLEYINTTNIIDLVYTFKKQSYTSFLYVSSNKIKEIHLITNENLTDTVNTLKNDVENIKSSVLTDKIEIIDELIPSQTYLRYALSKYGNTIENSSFNVYEYVVSPNIKIAITGRSPRDATYVAAAAFKGSELLQVYFVGTATNYNDEVIIIPDSADKLRVNTVATQTASAAKNVITYPEKAFYTKNEIDDLIGNSRNYWSGKIIWWCGTSIPAGSDETLGSEETVAGNYPTQVGKNLNATVINKSVGGSMCRANVRTGDYNGANFSNITSCLSMTEEEIENFITNYDSIKSKLIGNAPDSLSQSDLNRLRAASFETRLLPYLDGTYPMPDLFILDHGHNDFKYKLSNNKSDIDLKPTIDNITSGELAEDTYMTTQNNAKLESFFGSLDNIPSAKKEEFIASLNRNCYIGSMNFIITLILRYNPHARIIFISNYEYENGVGISYSPLIPVQEELSKSWAYPICKVWKCLGYSNHIIPSSKDWFNKTYPKATPTTTDITVYKAYLPDGVHPHSDITGYANKIYAGIISEFIKRYR